MKSDILFPKKPYRTRGGIHVPHFKNTATKETVEFPCPNSVTIPMSQHIGAPCTPVVKVGDHVDVGQLIGNSDAFVSAPIHSSISGTVKKVDKYTMPDGSKMDAVTIESDGEMTLSSEIKPPVIENREDFIKAVRQSGLVGLGGAGFPAHVKLNVPPDKTIDTLIVNVAECEPYITSDHRTVLEESWEIMSGIYAIKDILNIQRAIIAIENNKPDAIKVMRSIADNSADKDDTVRVLPLKATYPQGAEKILIQACTGREVPIGGLPADAGCIVMNIGSIAFLAKYMKTGIPLINKRLTVDGSAIKNPSNLLVPIGTPVKDIIEFTGGYKQTPYKLLMGGPMMGTALFSDEQVIQKQNNAILAFGEKEARLSAPSACIRCGRCTMACPMGLMPVQIVNAIDREDYEYMNKYYIMNCMECGCCSFSCPANRPLVHKIRTGKAMINNKKKKDIKKGGNA